MSPSPSTNSAATDSAATDPPQNRQQLQIGDTRPLGAVQQHPVAPPSPTTPRPAAGETITIRAWVDPLVDDHGHDPRSVYVETFWLGVLGPTATWLLRRFASELEAHPEGVDFDLVSTAASMGMSFRSTRSSAFSKALQRCVMFGLAHQLPDGGLAIRRRVPAVAQRHLRRLPTALQILHQEWESSVVTLDDLTRAHRLAMAMLEVGDEPILVEPQLRALGVASAVAEQVADNIAQLTSR